MGMYQPVEGDRVMVSRIGILRRAGSAKARYWDVVGDDGRSWSFEDDEFADDFWTFDKLQPKLPTAPGSVVRHELPFVADVIAVLGDDGYWVDAYNARRRFVKVTEVIFDAGAA